MIDELICKAATGQALGWEIHPLSRKRKSNAFGGIIQRIAEIFLYLRVSGWRRDGTARIKEARQTRHQVYRASHSTNQS